MPAVRDERSELGVHVVGKGRPQLFRFRHLNHLVPRRQLFTVLVLEVVSFVAVSARMVVVKVSRKFVDLLLCPVLSSSVLFSFSLLLFSPLLFSPALPSPPLPAPPLSSPLPPLPSHLLSFYLRSPPPVSCPALPSPPLPSRSRTRHPSHTTRPTHW